MKNYLRDFGLPDYKKPRIGVVCRILLSPIMLMWFLFQLFAFSFITGGFAVIFGLMVTFANLFELPKDREWSMAIIFIALPIIAPIVWIYRYVKFGEYSMLF